MNDIPEGRNNGNGINRNNIYSHGIILYKY